MATKKPKKVCVTPKDCSVVAARLDFKAAKGCAARTAAAEAFRAAAAKRITAAPKAMKVALFKEALRHVAGAHRSCGNEASAQKAEEKAKSVKVLPSFRATFPDYRPEAVNGLSGARRRRRRSRR